MSGSKRQAFDEFRYSHDGQSYIFRDYESLKNFRLMHTPFFLRPILRVKLRFERLHERQLELFHGLPERYLAGLVFVTRRQPSSIGQVADRIAKDYHYFRMQRNVSLAVRMFLPCTAPLSRRNCPNLYSQANLYSQLPMPPVPPGPGEKVEAIAEGIRDLNLCHPDSPSSLHQIRVVHEPMPTPPGEPFMPNL